MKFLAIILGSILVVLFMTNTSFASDDFQTRPPVFVYGERPKNVDPVFAYGERPKNVDVEIQTDRIGYRYKSPFLYFSMGIQTESTWFDRRLNWTSYSTQLAVDTGHFGIKYQGSMSNVGREDFELFDSRRAGDLVIFAADNWDFDSHIIGGHGSVRQVDMRMPMIFAGPEIKAGGRLAAARTVDVAPTLIDMISPDKLKLHNFDGHSLLPAMKQKVK